MLIPCLIISLLLWVLGIVGLLLNFRKPIKSYPKSERKVAIFFIAIWPITALVVSYLLFGKKILKGVKLIT